jgi:hypothetical protein
MKMTTFLSLAWEYRFMILVIVAVILYALFEWQSFKSKCYGIMLQAKRKAKDAILKSGDEQAEWVVKKAYQWLPRRLTMFISESMMRKIIYYLYHKSKDYIDDGQINNSIK